MNDPITRWLAAALVAGVVLAVPVLLDGPSDAEAMSDTAAQVEEARIDEWLQAARRANPHLTDHELLRIRAAVIYAERRQR